MPDRVVICIPTFRRPRMLRRLLEAIAALETSADISVLVADNDARDHAGFDLCRSLRGYRWPLEAVIAHERGIAQARNRLIEEALKTDAAFIAMIDDDEWPQQDWIGNFLKAAHETGADVLQGSILFGRESAADGHADIRRATGPAAMLQGAGNLLIRRAVLEEMAAPWFDPQFALSGGEDQDFFVRLAHAGKRFAWCDEARAFGDVPESRAGLGWLLRRAYSVGNSDMRVLLKHRPGAARLAAELAKILAALLLAPPVAVILAASPNRRAVPLQKLSRAAGKLSAMLGVSYNEYAVIHGG
ncbi:MAG TPA: glycosyltransferase family A protein [Rhizomicrobium sp.]|nr:glycosyltransferase family A protein [Rhizomicrobium sp.]